MGNECSPVAHASAEELSNTFISNQSDSIKRFPYIPDFNEGVSFQEVDYVDIVEAFNKIKSTAVGCDGFTLKLLKLVFPFAGSYVWHIVNTVLRTSTFPKEWKVAMVIPIHRKGNSNSMDNVRPVSIMPTLSKMMEHTMKLQVIGHLDSQSM